MAVLLVSADVAVAGRWAVNGSGECVQEWTPSSLARGPLAMTNAVTFPGRQLVGGGAAAYDEPSRSTTERVILVPTLALLGLGSGTVEGVFVMGKGMADFVTGECWYIDGGGKLWGDAWMIPDKPEPELPAAVKRLGEK